MLSKIINNRYLGLIGTVIGLLGVLLSIYFYLQSKEKRELVYAINPSKALVVDSKGSKDLQVLFNNKLVSSDVVAIQIAFWNNGNISIKKENILKSIIIKPLNDIKILEVKFRKISREVTNITAIVDSANYIKINWDILEKNDGAVLQILFSGKIDTRFNIDGIIESQSNIAHIEYDTSKGEIKPMVIIILGLVMTMIGIFTLRKSQILFDYKSKDLKLKIAIQVLRLFMVYSPILLIFLGIYRLVNEPIAVPFGF